MTGRNKQPTGFQKVIGTSKSGYFYVYYRSRRGGKDTNWRAYIDNGEIKHSTHHKTEKEAAIAIDKVLILNGYEPVNVLKRKQ